MTHFTGREVPKSVKISPFFKCPIPGITLSKIIMSFDDLTKASLNPTRHYKCITKIIKMRLKNWDFFIRNQCLLVHVREENIFVILFEIMFH